MPLDAARLARGQAMLHEMADQERERNHQAALHRIHEEAAARAAATQALLERARAAGACPRCALHQHMAGHRDPKLVRHRGACPRVRA
jgi:hypothetical protein